MPYPLGYGNKKRMRIRQGLRAYIPDTHPSGLSGGRTRLWRLSHRP